jgi:hypothetical protein
MFRNPLFCSLCLLGAAAHGYGQVADPERSGVDDVRLTGNINVDFFGMSSPALLAGLQDGDPAVTHPRKSPWLAAGMSLLVPGAGEFYSESYWKAAAFFAAGVTAWTIAYTQNKKGDDQTAFYEDYANRNWSVRQYAEWTLNNATHIDPGIDLSLHQDVLVGDTDVDWTALNDLERDLGNWYSHTLPLYGEQQYYELIGKYQQYYQGWSDADPSLDDYDDVSNKLNAGGTQFTYYSAERGKANDYYNTSHTAVTVAVVTHVVSAIDGAWSASSYNKQLDAGVGFMRAMDGPLYVSYPAFQVAYRF